VGELPCGFVPGLQPSFDVDGAALLCSQRRGRSLAVQQHRKPQRRMALERMNAGELAQVNDRDQIPREERVERRSVDRIAAVVARVLIDDQTLVT
jgi:hypothetical protein